MATQNIKGLTVITIPKKINNRMAKIQKMKESKQKYILQNSKPGNTSIPIISCQSKRLNFYKGQAYGKFEKVPLASETWKSRRTKGDYFTINKFLENPAFKNYTEDGINSFEQLGLDPRLVKELQKNGFERPTNIQTLAIPHILEGSNTVIAAETGNGKTLAFLAPIVHQLLNSRQYGEDHFMNSPRALVITPGRELVIQTRDMARMIGYDLGINVNSIVGGRTKQLLLNPKIVSTDILVGSFGALSKLITNRVYKTHRVSKIVLDEADTLLDDTFIEHMTHFLSKFSLSDRMGEESNEFSGVQLIFAGATYPQNVEQILGKIIDVKSLVTVKTPYLHRVSPHINQTFVKVNPSEKAEKLLKFAKRNQREGIPTIIFSNTSSTSDWVSIFLNQNGIPCINLNGAMSFHQRSDKFRIFQNEEVLFLSCTDVVSRGLDTVRAKHILNFDFPKFMADYIHRCGRTGRVGSEDDCHITNFVAKKNEAALVQKIEYAIRKVENLSSVNANIKRLITNKTERYGRELLRKKEKEQEHRPEEGIGGHEHS